jgi:pterin-4a-carbinolamine dehydratase
MATIEQESFGTLRGLPGWQRHANNIRKTFHLDDFAAATRFVDRVALDAAAVGRQPAIDVRGGRVSVAFAPSDGPHPDPGRCRRGAAHRASRRRPPATRSARPGRRTRPRAGSAAASDPPPHGAAGRRPSDVRRRSPGSAARTNLRQAALVSDRLERGMTAEEGRQPVDRQRDRAHQPERDPDTDHQRDEQAGQNGPHRP